MIRHRQMGTPPVLTRFWMNRRGATAIEYCLIAGIVSLAVLVGATSIGTKLQARYFAPIAAGLS